MSLDLLLASPATLILLAANILVSMAALNTPALQDRLLFWMRPVRQGRELERLVTSGFVHTGPIHLMVNMLTLFFVGPVMEQMIGTTLFVAVYAGSLLGGSALSFLENIRNTDYRAAGASGALSGVMLVFALLQPFAMIYVFFAIPMPAILFALLYIGYSIFASGQPGQRLDHAAHLGGALTGVVFVCLLWPQAIGDLWTEIVARVPGLAG
jgi:membrane associated rhomboid family serine protease